MRKCSSQFLIATWLCTFVLSCTSAYDNCTSQVSILYGNSGDCAVDVNIKRLALDNADGEDDDPSLIAAQDGKFYLVYLSDKSGNKELWVSSSTDGTTWSTPQQITDDPEDDLYPTLLQTTDERFHLFWHRFNTGSGESHLYYRSTMDPLAWGASDTQVTVGVIDDQDPKMIFTGTSELRVIFSSAERSTGLGKPSYNRDLYMIRSLDSGTSWQPPTLVTISSDSESDRYPALLQTDSNQFYLIFQRHDSDTPTDPTSNIQFATSTDGLTFNAPTQITADAGNDEPDVFANFFRAPLYDQWMMSWTSTSFSATGGLVNLALNQSAYYSANAIDLTTLIGSDGWSTRVATLDNQTSLIVWVSNSTGKPQLWAALLPL